MDRECAEFSNIKAVVVRIEDNGTYKLGTKHGLIKQLFTRNQFTPCVENFLDVTDVPISQEKEVSVREVAKLDSIGTGQGFIKCSCKSSCTKNRCKCVKSLQICNSHCKCSNFCKNVHEKTLLSNYVLFT